MNVATLQTPHLHAHDTSPNSKTHQLILCLFNLIIYMAVVNFTRHYVFLPEAFKRFNSKGYAQFTYPAIIAKQRLEKKQGILLTYACDFWFNGSHFCSQTTPHYFKLKISEYTTKAQYSHGILQKKEVWTVISKELNVPKNDLRQTASKLQVQCDSNVTDVKATIDFLKQYGFENSVIAESVIICFFPIKVIQKGLEKIAKNEDKLSRFGLTHGFTNTECKFTNGSTLKDKRLQLCLYYMDLPQLENTVSKITKQSL